MADMSHVPARASFDWRRIPVRAVDRWAVAIDLGKSNDSTAISVLHHTVTPSENWTPFPLGKYWKQDSVQRFDLVHLERLPLGLSYVDQVERIAAILDREPLQTLRPDTVWDQTGVGAGVVDIAENRGLRPNRIAITGSLEANHAGPKTWNVPKAVLISRLEAAMHTKELHVAAALREGDTFRDELRDFERRTSETGRNTWSARSGSHDDIVLSVAIGIWFLCNRPTTSREPLMI